MQQTAGGSDRRAIAGDASWTDYTLTLKARKLGGAEGFLIMFHLRDQDNWVWWNLGGWGNTRHALENCVAGGKSILGNEVPGRIDSGRWYDIRVETLAQTVRCYLDGRLVHDVRYPEIEPLHAVASRLESSGESVLKVVNAAGQDCAIEITLDGVAAINPNATAAILTSARPTDENSLDEPHKVAPIQRTIDYAARSFRHSFPANSLTVLRLVVR